MPRTPQKPPTPIKPPPPVIDVFDPAYPLAFGALRFPIATTAGLLEYLGKLRAGRGDQLLLQRGATVDLTGPLRLPASISGAAGKPTIIGAYGDPSLPRPRVICRTDAVQLSSGLHDLVLHDIQFESWGRDPGKSEFSLSKLNVAGVTGRGLTDVHRLTIERCGFRWFEYGLACHAPNPDTPGGAGWWTDFTLRGCDIIGCWTTTAGGGMYDGQGIYTHKINGQVIEGNLFWHCGWHPAVPEKERTEFRHAMYLGLNSGPAIVRDNVIASACCFGTQPRCGGAIERNLYIDCGIASSLDGPGGDFSDNVIVGGHTYRMQPLDQPARVGKGGLFARGSTIRAVNNVFWDRPQTERAGYALAAIGISKSPQYTPPAPPAPAQSLNATGNVVIGWQGAELNGWGKTMQLGRVTNPQPTGTPAVELWPDEAWVEAAHAAGDWTARSKTLADNLRGWMAGD